MLLGDWPSSSLSWLRELHAVPPCTVHICQVWINDEGNCVEKLTLNHFITLRLFKPWRTAHSGVGNVFEARLWVMGLFSWGKKEIMRWDKGGFLTPGRINSQCELFSLSIPCCGWKVIMCSKKRWIPQWLKKYHIDNIWMGIMKMNLFPLRHPSEVRGNCLW